MTGTELGVCVIGTGRAGMIHAQNYAAGIPNCRLAALSDPYEPALRSAGEQTGITSLYADYHDALDDPAVDAVVIVTPTDLHLEVAVAAASAGKHVFCEKPMAMNEAECIRMIDACADAGVKLQIGFMRRFDLSYRTCCAQLRSGEIGEVNQVKSLTHGPSIPQPWMLDVGRSNGPLAEVSSHDIDTIRWLADSEIETVHAVASNYRCRDRAQEYPDFYDTFVLTCRFTNGVLGVIEGAVSVGYGYDARTEVLGNGGLLCVGDLRADRVTRFKRDGDRYTRTVPSWRNLFKDAYRAEAAGFVDIVLAGGDPVVTGYDGLQAVRVVNAGNESIRTGKTVTIDSEPM
jgi:predicted dehydrogenase